ncbi:MAG: thiolase family protein [Actinobacteria bacterium]|nr:thiolase family protein [Actinomycetota bacterium]
MSDAVIVAAVRTPVGRRGGALRGWHPVDLLAHVLRGAVERAGIDADRIDDVIVGCVDQVGEQALNVGRSAVLAAGFPEQVPATTVDRQCGSSQQAVHFAAQGVVAGAYDIVIAAGVESMTRVPMFANAPDRSALYGPAFRRRYGLTDDGFLDQGESGEIVADRFGLTREELDAFAVASHERAAATTREGRFRDEILPIVGADGQLMDTDEGIRPTTSTDALAALRTAFRVDGKLTAGNSSQISDGAAAILLTSASVAEALRLSPLARVHATAVVGVNPVEMLTGPIPATNRVLERSGLTIDAIGRYEVNEAFASIPLAWLREVGADPERMNVNGGAIALGHPLGASGARLMVTLVHELRRSGERFGLQAMCEGGGMANATILERL